MSASRKPTMVIAGEFWSGASGAGLSEGFRDLGWAVQDVDLRYFLARWDEGLTSRLTSRLTRNLTAEAFRARILRECRALKPDVFLTMKGLGLSTDLLARIKETGATLVMYYPDVDFNHPGLDESSFPLYDLFVTTKSFQLAPLKNRLGPDRVALVPHGFSERIHRPPYGNLSETDYRADAIHVGIHSAYKQKWLSELSESLPTLDLHLAGNCWEANVASGPLGRAKLLGERLGASYAEAIQASRVNIAIHYGPTASGWADTVSTRTFEIPACRGFMLHIDSDEVREFYAPGQEIDVFSTPAELREKVTFYLGRPDVRQAMIARAYARCVPAYSYRERARRIAELIGR